MMILTKPDRAVYRPNITLDQDIVGIRSNYLLYAVS